MARKQLTAEQKQKSEERRARFKEFCQRVASMSEDQRAELSARYGIVTCEGHSLSAYNCCLLISQAAEFMPSVVGGFRQWQKAGRRVAKGQSGLMIWVPTAKRKAAVSATGAAAAMQPADESGAERPGFVMGYVWDISQTETIEDQPAAE